MNSKKLKKPSYFSLSSIKTELLSGQNALRNLWFGMDNIVRMQVNWEECKFSKEFGDLRATSHTRLRARDHYISSILIGGKGAAGPSSLCTTLERDQQSM